MATLIRRVLATTVLWVCVAVHSGSAQAPFLSEEELLSLVDERAGALGPYRSLLNDPDPARSMAAMDIMLESGNSTLFRVATEFGLLSADPKMQRRAAEAILSSGVPLTIVLDGSGAEDVSQLTKSVRTYNKGAVSPEGTVYISVAIGPFDAEQGCYVRPQDINVCVAAINGDGLFLTGRHIQARLGYGENGVLTGAASITGYDPSLPAHTTILE